MSKHKKHKKSPAAQEKSLETQEERLARGREWLAHYSGRHAVREYRKQFKVSVEDAARDLQALGAISQEEADNVCRSQQIQEERIREKRKNRKKRKAHKEVEEEPVGSPWDYMFYYVAGYTSGGFPYGIRFEDLSKADAVELLEIETDPDRRMQLQDRISFLEEHPEGYLPYGRDSRSSDSLSDLDDDFDELPF